MRMFSPLLFLAVTLAAPQDGSSLPGLRYEHRRAEGPLSLHLLEVDPQFWRIRPVRAHNVGIGRETVSSMALRKGAVAAVNAGFFHMGGRYDGDTVGILKIGPHWFSDPYRARGALGWKASDQRAQVARLRMRWELRLGDRLLPVDGINRARGPGEAILFTWAFHRTTLTNPDGVEMILRGKRVERVVRGGDSPIPPYGYVYSLGPRSPVAAHLFRPGQTVQVSYQLEVADRNDPEAGKLWSQMDFIISGTPVLIQEGRLITDFRPERVSQSFLEERHPRTAVCSKADGRWLFLVVDGRQPHLSIGMTMEELGRFLLSLGCLQALNLDGGGSSTFFFDGKIRNSPSDLEGERPVSDAIVVLPKEMPVQENARP